MTVHALSLRNRILLNFSDVHRARFEWHGYETRFFVDPDDEKVRAAVATFLRENQVMAAVVRLADKWVDGPVWPALFDQFNAVELDVIEACDSTKGSHEAVLLQLCRWIGDVRVDTVAGGHLRVVVETRSGTSPSTDQLRQCETIVHAAAGVPGLRVDVVAERVGTTARTVDPKLDAMLHWMENQSSRDGIQDPHLKKLFDDDEDFFADARSRSFPSRLPSSEGPPGIFLPLEPGDARIAPLLFTYERVYFPAHVFTEPQSEKFYGLTEAELLKLVEVRRAVPVLTERVGRHDQRRLRELTDRGNVVGPRRMTAALAAQILDANPLWRLPRKEMTVARAVLNDTDRLVAEDRAKLPVRLPELLAAWTAFSREGCAEFMNMVTNAGTRTPLHFGPGALASAVLQRFMGDNAPDLEARFVGLDVSYAASLHAACAPIPDERLYPMYEFLGSIAGNREVEDVDRLPTLLALPHLIDDLALFDGDTMSVDELILVTSDETIAEARKVLSEAFGSPETIEEGRRAAERIAARVRELDDADNRAARRAEHWELVGLIADAAAMTLDVNIPFASTILGHILKRSASWFWNKLDATPSSREVKAQLAALNHMTSPAPVRIQHLRKRMRKNT